VGLLGIFKPKALHSARLQTLGEALDRARSIHQQGRHADALAMCKEILERQPDHLDALSLSAEIAVMSGDSDRALQVYRNALQLKPDQAPVHYKYGNLLKDRGQMAAALASYSKAIELDPGYAQAFCNRGFVLERLVQWDAALASYDSALAITPDDALAHYNRSGVLRQLGRQEEAALSYKKAISLKPDYFEAYSNLGFLLIEMKRWDEALASLSKSIEINPCFAPTHFGRGMTLHERKEWDAALTSYDQALEIDPSHAQAHFHRGALLIELRQWSAARSSLERAVTLKPDFTDAYYSLGNLWMVVGQHELALANFDKAIALKPDYAEAHLSRATLLVAMKKFLEAIESYDRGAALKRDSRFVQGARQFAKRSVCDWSDLDAEVNLLAAGIEAGEMVSPPHQALVLVDSVQLHHKAAQVWVQATSPSNSTLPPISRWPRRDKARIGYFSGEFYLHPVPVLMAGVFEAHDRSQYEVTAFSYGAHSEDEFGMRLQRGFDHFIDVRGKSDRDVALLAREMQIDIAVDLAGHTGLSRTGIFACRAAPLQVNYLGYAGTMGAEYMDYLIADATVIPTGHEPFYAEKIVRLPNSFLPYDPSKAISSKAYAREELGLPSTGFVFCCFNNAYKITPEVFDSWMRILLRVPNSVLWLSQNNETVVNNLRRESMRRGVDAGRIIFAEHLASPADHLARHRAADLFLDTRPYNAHSTAIDALWMGLPVLTFPGTGFAGRVAASLLTAVQLPELIATNAGSYEDTAVQLAENPQFLAAIREKLMRKRVESPLFDTPRFVRYLEAGYSRMLERAYAELPPEHIHVPP
jgi:predicted O-linked N-acetylglucosamine transferase (SPINDLY family)